MPKNDQTYPIVMTKNGVDGITGTAGDDPAELPMIGSVPIWIFGR